MFSYGLFGFNNRNLQKQIQLKLLKIMNNTYIMNKNKYINLCIV